MNKEERSNKNENEGDKRKWKIKNTQILVNLKYH